MLRKYLIINYSGQRIGNPWNVDGGLVNIILMEISFVSSGLFLGFIRLIGFRSKIIILGLLFVIILAIMKFLKERIESRIDFLFLEASYISLKRYTKISYFIISILLLVLSVLSMMYLIKVILMLR